MNPHRPRARWTALVVASCAAAAPSAAQARFLAQPDRWRRSFSPSCGRSRTGFATRPTLLLVTRDGGLLYAEGVPPRPSVRRPPEGSPRDQRVGRLLDALLRSRAGPQP